MPVDIIIAIDTSGSMDEEVAELQANLNAYTTLLRDAGADPRIILLADGGVCIPPPLGAASCGAGADQNLPGYRHVTNAVQSTNALDVIIDSYAQYSDSLRAGALKSLMVISDDDSDVRHRASRRHSWLSIPLITRVLCWMPLRRPAIPKAASDCRAPSATRVAS